MSEVGQLSYLLAIVVTWVALQYTLTHSFYWGQQFIILLAALMWPGTALIALCLLVFGINEDTDLWEDEDGQ